MYTVLARVLCVDDEPNVLDGMARILRRHFDVTTALGGEQGLDRVERDGPFAVVISDQRMPVMDGVSFLSRVREASPDTVRILLTGYADTAAAIGAVNRGAVFRFLSKPIETPELLQTLNAAVEQHRLVTSERVLLERTLHGSIKAIVDVLALVNPSGFGRGVRAKEIVSMLAAAISAPDPWRVEIGAMIAQVGSVAQSSGVAPGGGPAAGADGGFAQVETSAVGRLSKIAADMVANIPRMEEVHAMLAHQELRYDGSGSDGRGPREQAIPLGARMLKIAFDLEALESQGMSRTVALDTMRGRWGWYDPQLLAALTARVGPGAPDAAAAVPTAAAAAAARSQRVTTEVEIRQLEPGMILAEDISTRAGRVVIGKGEAATTLNIRKVKGTLDFNELRRSVRVQTPELPPELPAAPPPPAPREMVSAGGMELDLTMRLTV